jgi:hypothetical protein
MGSLLLLLLIGGIVWYLWHQASFHHRVRKQQEDLLALQKRQIEVANRWAEVSERALARDEKALELEELERKWHDSDYRGMA